MTLFSALGAVAVLALLPPTRATAPTTVSARVDVPAPTEPSLRAVFHTKLERSAPAADSTVGSPSEIRLWFSERIEARLSSIALVNAQNAAVTLGPTRAGEAPESVVAAVPAPLAAGKYTVRWRTAGRDGHVIRGSYSFTVR